MDPGRHTGWRAGGLQLLLPNEPGYGGGNDWMTEAAAASAELAGRLRSLLGNARIETRRGQGYLFRSPP